MSEYELSEEILIKTQQKHARDAFIGCLSFLYATHDTLQVRDMIRSELDACNEYLLAEIRANN